MSSGPIARLRVDSDEVAAATVLRDRYLSSGDNTDADLLVPLRPIFEKQLY